MSLFVLLLYHGEGRYRSFGWASALAFAFGVGGASLVAISQTGWPDGVERESVVWQIGLALRSWAHFWAA